MEKLAGKRRLHYLWLLDRPGRPLRRECPDRQQHRPCRQSIHRGNGPLGIRPRVSLWRRDTARSAYCGLYRLSFCAGQSARHVAESAPAATSPGPGNSARLGHPAAGFALVLAANDRLGRPLAFLLVGSSLIHLLMVWGEVSLGHATAHARLAVWEMTQGRYRKFFWSGTLLSFLGGLFAAMWLYLYSPTHGNPDWIPVLGIIGPVLALTGVMLYEHAYVQAGQSVPLA